MKTITLTYYASGMTVTAGQAGAYAQDMSVVQGNLIGKEIAIFSIDWNMHCYANLPATLPYVEVAITKGVQLTTTAWVFASIVAVPAQDYPNILVFDSFNTLDGKGSKTWSDLYPHEIDQRDHLFFNILVDNGQSITSINPSYRVEMTVHYELLNTVREIRGY